MENFRANKPQQTPEQRTQRFYDENAKQWTAERGHSVESFYVEELEKLFELAPEGSILEVGVGSGKEAAILASRYQYTGVDISSGIINIARANNPDLDFVQASVTNLGLADDSFNNFFTAATLLHIPKADMQKALAEIGRVVVDGGVGFISLKEGEGEESVVEEYSRHFSYFVEDEFRAELAKAGFEVLEVIHKPDGRPGRPGWIEFFVRNRK